jgi:hypothetical protein
MPCATPGVKPFLCVATPLLAIPWVILGVFVTARVPDYTSALMTRRTNGPTMGGRSYRAYDPQQRLNFLPLPQGHGSFRPTFGSRRTIVPGLAPDGEGT